jgi:hypothetical protein
MLNLKKKFSFNNDVGGGCGYQGNFIRFRRRLFRGNALRSDSQEVHVSRCVETSDPCDYAMSQWKWRKYEAV